MKKIKLINGETRIDFAELFAKYDYLHKETNIVELWMIMETLKLF